MAKYSLIFASLCFGAICSIVSCAKYSAVSNQGAVPTWCHVNSSEKLAGTTGPVIQLESSKIFVVSKSKQQSAKLLLSGKKFFPLLVEQINLYLPGVQVQTGGHYTIVRGAAVFDLESDYDRTLRLEAFFYVDTKTVVLVSSALASPGTPIQDVAVIVETSAPVEMADAECEIAS